MNRRQNKDRVYRDTVYSYLRARGITRVDPANRRQNALVAAARAAGAQAAQQVNRRQMPMGGRGIPQGGRGMPLGMGGRGRPNGRPGSQTGIHHPMFGSAFSHPIFQAPKTGGGAMPGPRFSQQLGGAAVSVMPGRTVITGGKTTTFNPTISVTSTGTTVTMPKMTTPPGTVFNPTITTTPGRTVTTPGTSTVVFAPTITTGQGAITKSLSRTNSTRRR